MTALPTQVGSWGLMGLRCYKGEGWGAAGFASPVMVLGRQSQELLRGFLLALLHDSELLGTVVCSHRCPLAPRGTGGTRFLLSVGT